MGKHKKHLREEKAKLKLKKKLPKGQNITNTEFKVKKIQITEQLPDHVGIPVTFKNQTAQECLNYLTHHNLSKRADGLRGLKELFLAKKITPSSLEFKQVVSRVLDVAVEDYEGKIRRTAVKLLSVLITSLSAAARLPFSELINKQLQRALSNINPGIQTDGLQLLDLVLSITRSEDTSARQPLIGLLLRMLTMTGADAPPRAAVLHRLLATCQIVFDVPEVSRITVKNIDSSESAWPLTSTYKNLATIPWMSGVIPQAREDPKKLIERIIKVSIGVWTEISPDRHLNKDVVAVLSSIVKLSLLLFKYCTADRDSLGLKSWFLECFKMLLGRNLLQHFPYSGPELIQTGRQPDLVEGEVDKAAELMRLNLNLATLYFLVQPNFDLLPKIQQFLPAGMAVRPVSDELITLLDSMLRIKNLQSTLVVGVAASCVTEPDHLLSDWLQKVALNETLQHFWKLEQFQAWLCTLLKDPGRGKFVAQMASRDISPKLTSALKLSAKKILSKSELDRDLVHALYWVYTKEELLQKAEGCPVVTINYLHNII